jgi:hypothetical protein
MLENLGISGSHDGGRYEAREIESFRAASKSRRW